MALLQEKSDATLANPHNETSMQAMEIPNILLVDDNFSDRELFRIALHECCKAFVLIEADSVDEALQILKHERPYLIITDINMPRISGLEMLTHLKADSRYKNIPVIIWSSSSRDADVCMAKEKGALDYFIKPDNYDLLVAQANNIFAQIENLHKNSN
jgi:CheY-like chemotaxis protein